MASTGGGARLLLVPLVVLAVVLLQSCVLVSTTSMSSDVEALALHHWKSLTSPAILLESGSEGDVDIDADVDAESAAEVDVEADTDSAVPAAAQSNSAAAALMQEYDDFLIRHRKPYNRSSKSYDAHFQQYSLNRGIVMAHNEKVRAARAVNASTLPFTLRLGHLGDHHRGMINLHKGYKLRSASGAASPSGSIKKISIPTNSLPIKHHHRRHQRKPVLMEVTSLSGVAEQQNILAYEAGIDWSKYDGRGPLSNTRNGEQCATPIQYQGPSSACWAFASVAVLESSQCTGKLSEIMLLECCNSEWVQNSELKSKLKGLVSGGFSSIALSCTTLFDIRKATSYPRNPFVYPKFPGWTPQLGDELHSKFLQVTAEWNNLSAAQKAKRNLASIKANEAAAGNGFSDGNSGYADGNGGYGDGNGGLSVSAFGAGDSNVFNIQPYLGQCAISSYPENQLHTLRKYSFGRSDYHSFYGYPLAPASAALTGLAAFQCWQFWTVMIDSFSAITLPIDASADEFHFLGDGVYAPDVSQYKKSPIPDHAVAGVGYGEYNGSKYILVKNSWSENWGNKGYARISWDFIVAGLLTNKRAIEDVYFLKNTGPFVPGVMQMALYNMEKTCRANAANVPSNPYIKGPIVKFQ